MREFKPYDRDKYDLDPRSEDEILADRESTVIYFQPLRDNRSLMTLEQKGHLLDSMMDWAEFDKAPDFKGDKLLQSQFNSFRNQERINRTTYIVKARKGKQAVEERERKKREQQDGNSDDESG